MVICSQNVGLRKYEEELATVYFGISEKTTRIDREARRPPGLFSDDPQGIQIMLLSLHTNASHSPFDPVR